MKEKEALVDVLIPIIVPNDGITRSELAKQLKLPYKVVTNSLERLRSKRLLRRHIKQSNYIYTLRSSRKALSVGRPSQIVLN